MASSGWQRSGIDRHERGATLTRRSSTDTVTQQHTHIRGSSLAPAELPVRPDMQLAGHCPAAQHMQPPGGLYISPQCYWSYPHIMQLQPASGLAADSFPDCHLRSASTASFVRAGLYPPAPHDYPMQHLRCPYFLGPGNVPMQLVTIFQPVPPPASNPLRPPAPQPLEQHRSAARISRVAPAAQSASNTFKVGNLANNSSASATPLSATLPRRLLWGLPFGLASSPALYARATSRLQGQSTKELSHL